MQAIDVIGHMELDEESLRQLQAFIQHYEPHIIEPARKTNAGWIWRAFLKGHDGVCTIVTVDLAKAQASGIDDWVSQVTSLAQLHHAKVNQVLVIHQTSAMLLPVTADKMYECRGCQFATDSIPEMKGHAKSVHSQILSDETFTAD
jgi:hypothetical protein